jgi:hypothetical protein
MKVVVPTQLRSYTAGRAELRDLDRQFPGFRFRVIDEQDRVRRHVILFVGGEREDDITSAVPAGAELQIVGALSGG